jgi:hypothetical protein
MLQNGVKWFNFDSSRQLLDDDLPVPNGSRRRQVTQPGRHRHFHFASHQRCVLLEADLSRCNVAGLGNDSDDQEAEQTSHSFGSAGYHFDEGINDPVTGVIGAENEVCRQCSLKALKIQVCTSPV